MEINGGRTGPPANPMYHNGIASEISQTGRDASGRKLRGENKSMMNRINHLGQAGQEAAAPRPETYQTWKSPELQRSCQSQSRQSNAELKFLECVKGSRCYRGRSAKVFSAACLYAACRENGLS